MANKTTLPNALSFRSPIVYKAKELSSFRVPLSLCVYVFLFFFFPFLFVLSCCSFVFLSSKGDTQRVETIRVPLKPVPPPIGSFKLLSEDYNSIYSIPSHTPLRKEEALFLKPSLFHFLFFDA